MATIHVLDEKTVNRIAAGEVIERPASVVKELLENAVDAGATSVTAEIREGGLSMIRVTDNGCGIGRDDIRAAFLPHATSKIQSAEDLWGIDTLGFRGEALASIASIARVEVITRAKEALEGLRYEICGGEETACGAVGAPAGTTIIVRDLFYTAPVRRRFLRSAATEAGYVFEVISHIALSRPDISFRFIQNGQTKLFTSGNHDLRDIIYSVYGRETASELLPFEGEHAGMRLSGFLGKPSISRGNRSCEHFFINGRAAACEQLTRALEEAYRPYLMQHRFPFAVITVELSSARLDVNVHPAKREVRFREPEEVRDAVLQVVGEVLEQRELLPADALAQEEPAPKNPPKAWQHRPEPFEEKRQAAEAAEHAPQISPASQDGIDLQDGPDPQDGNAPQGGPDPQDGISPRRPAPAKTTVLPGSVITSQEEQPTLFSERILAPEKRAEFRIIGQVFKTYWLVEYQKELLIVDQHAAHEKVLYERLMHYYRGRTEVPVQRLSPPIVITLQPRERTLLERYEQIFRQAGFELEDFGGNEVAAYGVPADFSSVGKADWLREMIDSLSEEGMPDQPEIVLDKIASMSCKAAVKGNTRLLVPEMEALLEEMLLADQPYTCPHGRPTVIRISEYEMEKKFKRIL